MKKIFFLLLILVSGFWLLVTFTNAQEQITITTYYPSPHGSYQELRAQRMAIGNNYINRSVVCWNPPCPGGGVDISDTPTRNIDLIVEGSVGIGTVSPSTKLDIKDGDLVVGNNPTTPANWATDGQSGISLGGVYRTSWPSVATGSYTGNGESNREITVGFRPKVVVVICQCDETPPVVRTNTMPAGGSKGYGGEWFTPPSNKIVNFTDDGFTVGDSGKVNGAGRIYHWYAMWQI